MKPTKHVDAIVCYHNHEEFIWTCYKSLEKQMRQFIVVNDGGPRLNNMFYKEFRRETRHSPANSFNYGAFHSNADWLLYVDPHNIYKQGAIKQMLAHAKKEDYDCVFGTGQHFILGPESPWVNALSTVLNAQVAPWTFMLTRELWEELEGIPEPLYAHMPVLTAELNRRGIRAGWVNNCVDHVVNSDFLGCIGAFYEAGRMDAILHQDKVRHDSKAEVAVEQIKAIVGDEELKALLNMVFVGMYQLGVIEGLDAIPQAPVPVELSFRWEQEEV